LLLSNNTLGVGHSPWLYLKYAILAPGWDFWTDFVVCLTKTTWENFREMCFSNVNSTNFANFGKKFPIFYIKNFGENIMLCLQLILSQIKIKIWNEGNGKKSLVNELKNVKTIFKCPHMYTKSIP
jgi:hypothetical protein